MRCGARGIWRHVPRARGTWGCVHVPKVPGPPARPRRDRALVRGGAPWCDHHCRNFKRDGSCQCLWTCRTFICPSHVGWRLAGRGTSRPGAGTRAPGGSRECSQRHDVVVGRAHPRKDTLFGVTHRPYAYNTDGRRTARARAGFDTRVVVRSRGARARAALSQSLLFARGQPAQSILTTRVDAARPQIWKTLGRAPGQLSARAHNTRRRRRTSPSDDSISAPARHRVGARRGDGHRVWQFELHAILVDLAGRNTPLELDASLGGHALLWAVKGDTSSARALVSRANRGLGG